ncbi:MAG: adenylyl-sulfate kinase [Tannerellaceae bacterium]|jgi:adenylylsulfate kinase|nr:adenylyl-sulfate kinase [Tannerellaceae bacterium]
MDQLDKNSLKPVFDKMLSKEEKEWLLKQHSVMIWLTGLSGSGKSTIAIALEKELHSRGLLCCMLDGDNIRSGINKNLDFTTDDRIENIRRIAEVAKLFMNIGVITIAAFISPEIVMRELAASIVGKDDFLEIYISTPLEVCEKRDVKGLYSKARKGKIDDFTGITAPYEPPLNPDLTIDTSDITVEEAVGRLLELVLPKIDTRR